MSFAHTLMALVLAFVAMYGLGIPLAWLLPAPDSSPWVHRIAVGPLFAILLTSVAAWILRILGIPLHPLQLVALVVGAWVLAWVRTGSRWQLRLALRHAPVPALMVGTSGILWVASLAGYGLYVPNRDFKNHAYWVAQVAFSRTSDSRWVLRSSPLDPVARVARAVPTWAAYPPGLGPAHHRLELGGDHCRCGRPGHIDQPAAGDGDVVAYVGSRPAPRRSRGLCRCRAARRDLGLPHRGSPHAGGYGTLRRRVGRSLDVVAQPWASHGRGIARSRPRSAPSACR